MSTQAVPRMSTRTLIVASSTTLAAGLLLVLLLVRLLQAGNAASSVPRFPLVGHAAPNFAVAVWNGAGGQQNIQLSSYAGHPVVINFWASWCDPCAEEQPVINAAWQKYQGQGVRFLGVAFNDKPADGQAYLRQHAVAYPAGAPATDTVAIDYSVTGPPETVFVNRAGIVVDKITGPIDDGTLDREIQKILR
jgi:cytochrome c biogenesis protein CcmG/thiol:disulfide interchange protein DsbE